MSSTASSQARTGVAASILFKRMSLKSIPLGLAAVVAISACSTASTSTAATAPVPEQQPSVPQEQSAQSPSAIPSVPAETPSEPLLSQGPDCTPWAEYRPTFTDSFSLSGIPYMPPGFESGCAFRVGMGMGSTVHILRDGIDLSTLMLPNAEAATDGPIPWFEWNQVNSDLIETLVAQGDIVTFYEACVTNAGYTSNCEGFPEEEAYVLDNHTACYDGRCLNMMGPHAVYLLSMWYWPNEIYDLPTSFSAAESSLRMAYSTIPLNQLSPEVSTYGQAPEIAQALFGRTTLEEGMQPSEIQSSWQAEPDGLYVAYVTNNGMGDDAVGGERYRLEFVSADGDQQKLVWVGKQHRCLRGDNSDWTTELCP